MTELKLELLKFFREVVLVSVNFEYTTGLKLPLKIK